MIELEGKEEEMSIEKDSINLEDKVNRVAEEIAGEKCEQLDTSVTQKIQELIDGQKMLKNNNNDKQERAKKEYRRFHFDISEK